MIADGGLNLYLKHVNRHKTTVGCSNQFDCPECSASHYSVTDLKNHILKGHEYEPSAKRMTHLLTTEPVSFNNPSTSALKELAIVNKSEGMSKLKVYWIL